MRVRLKADEEHVPKRGQHGDPLASWQEPIRLAAR
jgi:hypothetical protein